jgi:hypothetical protein
MLMINPERERKVYLAAAGYKVEVIKRRILKIGGDELLPKTGIGIPVGERGDTGRKREMKRVPRETPVCI